MILITDGGSTKVDWVALDNDYKELFRERTKGLNPAILDKDELTSRIKNNYELSSVANAVNEVYFYGAGCGTDKAKQLLKDVLQSIFINAKIVVEEDMLAAVYAASKGTEAIVCILGTGSNSCYYDGKNMYQNVVSLGYILMDEASGNYFGKKLIQDYYYKRMPAEIARSFEQEHDLTPDEIKRNLYVEDAPNAFLGKFAAFMYQFKEHPYIRQVIKDGFTEFFENRIVPYPKYQEKPLYFIGTIAYFFRPELEEVAREFGTEITGVIRRPIDGLVAYHKELGYFLF